MRLRRLPLFACISILIRLRGCYLNGKSWRTVQKARGCSITFAARVVHWINGDRGPTSCDGYVYAWQSRCPRWDVHKSYTSDNRGPDCVCLPPPFLPSSPPFLHNPAVLRCFHGHTPWCVTVQEWSRALMCAEYLLTWDIGCIGLSLCLTFVLPGLFCYAKHCRSR